MRMLVIFILTPDESGAKGGAGGGRGLVLYATQECAQPALFIAPPRYRIHSRQKQRASQCGPYLFTAIPRFWYQLALWVFRDVDSVCLTAYRGGQN